MKTNKGYSLAELLVSIAIFSVVMVSIITVMRNVSVTYRNENAEVNLQENSQMLLAQMEELLVDCKSVSLIGTKTWSITDTDNVAHVIRLQGIPFSTNTDLQAMRIYVPMLKIFRLTVYRGPMVMISVL